MYSVRQFLHTEMPSISVTKCLGPHQSQNHLCFLFSILTNPKFNYPYPRITRCRAIPIMLFPRCKESCSRMRFCQESCSRMHSGFCEAFAVRVMARNVQQPFGPYIGHFQLNPGSGFRHVYRRPPTISDELLARASLRILRINEITIMMVFVVHNSPRFPHVNVVSGGELGSVTVGLHA